MSIDHVAITTKDLAATHRFYTEAIGFTLAKVEVLDTPGGGWMRHAFYDTGGGSLLAVFDFHDESIGDYRTDLSTGLGLPNWANHVAFAAPDLDALEVQRLRLLEHGHGCAVMDHDESISVYADDPNGIMVEFCTRVRSVLTEENRRRALDLIHADAPAVTPGEPAMELFDPAQPRALVSDIIEQARGLAGISSSRG